MTKSQLFKKAHALARATIKAGDDYRATFALCLKAIIADSKEPAITPVPAELLSLVGSEKQIKWANSIRKENMFNIDYLLDFISKSFVNALREPTHRYHKQAVNLINALNAIKYNDQAKFWIENGRKNGHDFEVGHLLINRLGQVVITAGGQNKMAFLVKTLRQNGYTI